MRYRLITSVICAQAKPSKSPPIYIKAVFESVVADIEVEEIRIRNMNI